jgi:hypothetical protein
MEGRSAGRGRRQNAGGGRVPRGPPGTAARLRRRTAASPWRRKAKLIESVLVARDLALYGSESDLEQGVGGGGVGWGDEWGMRRERGWGQECRTAKLCFLRRHAGHWIRLDGLDG